MTKDEAERRRWTFYEVVIASSDSRKVPGIDRLVLA
jgi:hypothetical protein